MLDLDRRDDPFEKPGDARLIRVVVTVWAAVGTLVLIRYPFRLGATAVWALGYLAPAV